LRRFLKRYQGAGILFCWRGPKGWEVLLAERRSGVWSLPAGGRDNADADLWATAKRETIEEFGWLPQPARLLFAPPILLLPFYRWQTFVLKLEAKPDRYPDFSTAGFRAEFRQAAWFPLSSLPPRTHPMHWPTLLWLSLRHRS
jgi:8-oxo-dGTP pyrophosphatase MutT (NUDIX family)